MYDTQAQAPLTMAGFDKENKNILDKAEKDGYKKTTFEKQIRLKPERI